MRHLKSAVLAAGMLGFCLQSHAVAPIAEANIDWTSFSYQLFDLDPLDGVAASLTWDIQGSGTTTNVWNPGSTSDWTSTAQSTNDVSVASATESALNVSYYGYQYDYLGSSTYRYGSFTLSAMTLVVFTVDGSVSLAGVTDPSANAGGWVQLSVNDDDSVPTSYSYSELYLSTYESVLNKSGVLTTSFVNLTESGKTAQMGALAQLYVNAPVPEPHTYGMMLAGLAVMAQVARRRCRG